MDDVRALTAGEVKQLYNMGPLIRTRRDNRNGSVLTAARLFCLSPINAGLAALAAHADTPQDALSYAKWSNHGGRLSSRSSSGAGICSQYSAAATAGMPMS